MQDREKELLETYRAEAAGFFAANQAARTAGERAIALIGSVVALAVAAGINAGTDDVAIPLPGLVLLLVAHMLHQYADLTVMGVARGMLEKRVNELLDDDALVYETAVADVRDHGLLVTSMRLLQGFAFALVVAVLVVGTIVAFDDQRWYVEIGFVVATAGGLVTASVAFAGMRRSREIAEERIGARLQRVAED